MKRLIFLVFLQIEIIHDIGLQLSRNFSLLAHFLKAFPQLFWILFFFRTDGDQEFAYQRDTVIKNNKAHNFDNDQDKGLELVAGESFKINCEDDFYPPLEAVDIIDVSFI